MNPDSKMKVFKLFNSKYFVKREIPIELITGISLSEKSYEFVLHVSGEYDYRLATEHRYDMMLSILKA